MTKNKVEKDIDNNESPSINASQGVDVTKKPSKKAEESASSDLSEKNNSSSDEFTVDPITGVKYLKPKGDSVSLGQRNFRIPTIRRDGFEIIWAVTRGNDIGNLVLQGWDFVDPNTPGCEEAGKTPYAGTDQTSKPVFHRALQMPTEKYQAMMAARSSENSRKEQEIIYNVKSGVDPANQKDFYISKESNMGRDREHGRQDFGGNSSGMTSGTSNGYANAMR